MLEQIMPAQNVYARFRLTCVKALAGLLLAAALFWGAGPAEGVDIPRAQLDESERHFTRAYSYFMDRDYWNALDYLDRALKANTYLVDYYLMAGLTLQRAGNGEGARTALGNYLEVRPMDSTVPRIVRHAVDQDRLLRAVLGTRPLSTRWQLSGLDMVEEWRTGFTRPFSARGLGKAEAFGDIFCLSDTLGNRVFLMPGRKRNFQVIPVERPAVTLPMGDGTFVIFCEGGELLSFSSAPNPLAPEGLISVDSEGRVDSFVVDAEFVSAGEFAVADPVAREVAFYSRDGLLRLAGWAPPDPVDGADLLFEPVALEGYADWLAVADRGNGRVYVLNTVNRRDFFFTDIPVARDVLWSPLGELFVLTERGEIYCLGVDFGERRIAAAEPLWSGLENIWSLFASSQGDLYCIDVAAARLRKASMFPSQALNHGFLSVYRPAIALEANRESFLLDATLSAPFASYLQGASFVVHCVWNERTIPSAAWWREAPAFDGLLLHRPLAQGQLLPLNLREAQAERGADVWAALPPVWFLHRGTLTNVIVDASIIFSIEDLLQLLRFCLMNGLRLDVWARDIPSLALARASAFTGGRTVFSLRNTLDLAPPQTRLQIQIPLPVELSSSGYPGRSMLAVYLDAGFMQTRAWIPLWPDMLGR